MIRWTREAMLAAMRDPVSGYAVCERALWYVWLGQTADERGDRTVRYKNGRGFNEHTARNGTWIGNEIDKVVRAVGEDGAPWGNIVNVGWVRDKVRKIAEYHARQVADIENDRLTGLVNTLRAAA
jgi:hypothetical protein